MSDEAKLRTAASRIASLRPPEVQRSPWWGRMGVLLAVALVGAAIWARFGTRPEWRGLAVDVSGPPPDKAPTLLFFLHGHGGSNGDVAWVAESLRAAGVSGDTSIAFLQGPYTTGMGHHWGEDSAERATSRLRLRKAIDQAIGASPVAGQRVFIAGFSRGAQLAAEIASEEPRIVGVVLLSPCGPLRPELLQRSDVLVAHGSADRICHVDASEELVDRLKKERLDVTWVPFEGDHVIAPAAIEAMATFLAPLAK